MEQLASVQESQRTRGPSAYIVWGIFIIWISFSTGLFIEPFRMPFSWRFVLTYSGTLLFFALYLRNSWLDARRLTSDMPSATRASLRTWAPLIAMFILSLIMVLYAGPDWGGLLIYTAAISASHLPMRQGLLMLVVVLLTTITGTILERSSWQAVLASAFTVIVTGFTTMVSMWAFAANKELRRVRQELARLAVTEERLRFARDLHDLLGHTLSLIALKSELARRLVQRAPDRAASEIEDIEAAARQALHEVREAVAGYRQPTLAGELQAAQEMLAAAGIGLTIEEDDPTFPLRATTEGMLAWTVREGVTNVIRHSRAQQCTIRLGYQDNGVSLSLSDDGQGAAKDAGDAEGNGLRGLRERARELGGTCVAERQADGGFRLNVTLPRRVAPKSATMALAGEERQR